MDILALLTQIFQVCIIPLIGLLTAYLTAYIRAKSADLAKQSNSELAAKYLQMATETVVACVEATNQTYVDSLKSVGAFDAEAQKKAFANTKDAVLAILSEESKVYLASFYGDLDKFLDVMIESQVKANKTEYVEVEEEND